MARFILFYEHLVREWNALYRVKKILESNGNKAECFSIIYETNKALKYAKRNKVNVIAVPWFVDEEHEKLLQPFIAVHPNIIIVNLHQEQIGSKSSEAVFIPRTPYTSNGCYHFAWGPSFYELLAKSGVDTKKIFITGNMRTDFTSFEGINKQEIISKYHLDNKKKIILFAENRGYYIQRIDDRYAISLIKRGLTKESINKRKEYEKISLQKFVEDLQSLPTAFWNEYQLVYRPHPGTNSPSKMPEFVHIISDLSIYDWISICDIYVTCGSTSIFEADMCGKICLTCDAVDEPDDQRINGLNFYHHIKTLSEITDSNISLEDELKRQLNEKNYQKYMGIVDGNSCNRVAETLIMLAEKKEKNMTYNIATPSAKEVLRRKLYEKATWFMTKTRLLYIFKYPRSAFAESRDIPYSKDAQWIIEKNN